MKQSIFFPLFIFLLFGVACSPTTEPGSAPAGVAQSNATIEITPRPTNTPTTTPSPSSTPTEEPTAILPTPILTPEPLPSPSPSDETNWVGGFLLSHTQLQPGNSGPIPSVPPGGLVYLEPANEEIAAHIDTLPTGDVTVLVTGKVENREGEFWVIVEEIGLANLPYTEETPLDATYTDDELGFSFSYPAGWFITPLENYNTAILRVDNVPSFVREQGLWPGREFIEPTIFDFTLHHQPDTTFEDYLADRLTNTPCLDEKADLTINGHAVTRIIESCYGITVEYIIVLDGQLFTFNSWSLRVPFIERVLTTFESSP